MASALTITSPLQGTVWQLKVAVGDEVREGQDLVIIESMKMEHPIKAPESGVIGAISIEEAATVAKGQVLLELTPQAVSEPVAVEVVADTTTRDERNQRSARDGGGCHKKR